MSNLSDIGKQIRATTEALAKADAELKWELAASAADVAGMIDPTPASDLIGAGLAVRKGDWLGAGMSLVSVVPYLGDAVAKPAKAVRAAKRINELRQTVAKLTAKLADLRKTEKQAQAAETAAKKAEIAKDAVEAKAAKEAAGGQKHNAKSGKDKDCEDCGPQKPPPVMKRMPLKRIKPCFSAAKLDPSKDKEFTQQLKRQEEALNRLTVDEYLKARAFFKSNGRGGGGAQRSARQRFEKDLIVAQRDELRAEGMSSTAATEEATRRAKKVMKELAALHEPDMIAGGRDVVQKMGDRSVNSSIGSQWRSRIDALDSAADKIPEAQRGATLMNAKLPKCK
ncbi:MAG: polymorphic toxin type 15 domain-containing protein [Pseudomonadota bacterium]